MKMNTVQYAALLADADKIATHFTMARDPSADVASLWPVVHEINAQRSYGDSHPRWAGFKRILEPSHVDSRSWLSDLYEGGLNDDHIRTALNKLRVDWVNYNLPADPMQGRVAVYRRNQYVIVPPDNAREETHAPSAPHLYRVVNTVNGHESVLYTVSECRRIIDLALRDQLNGSFQ